MIAYDYESGFGLVQALEPLGVPVLALGDSRRLKPGDQVVVGGSGGQVQLGSELWTAESIDSSESIGKGDKVEVVEVKGLRLKVRKIK